MVTINLVLGLQQAGLWAIATVLVYVSQGKWLDEHRLWRSWLLVIALVFAFCSFDIGSNIVWK